MNKILNKYHRQASHSKKRIYELKTINKSLNLKLNPKKIEDALRLMIYETGLKNKIAIEKHFEAIRNANLDMWENIQFNERNLILDKELRDLRSEIVSFQYEDALISIPFFNKLLNTLYNSKTAILELPQFFKLYTNYDKDMEPLENYGLEPYIANMSDFEFIAKHGTHIILFSNTSKVFYELKDKGDVIEYPMWANANVKLEDIDVIARLILEKDELKLAQYLIKRQLIKPKAYKKLTKFFKKKGITL